MGVRGELYSARIRSSNDRRTYFINVKENRHKDLFLTIVESKKSESGEEYERHQVVVFEDDLHLFYKGFEQVMDYIRNRRTGEGESPSGHREARRYRERPVEHDHRSDYSSDRPRGPRRDSGDNRSDRHGDRPRGPRRDSGNHQSDRPHDPRREDRGPRRDDRGPRQDRSDFKDRPRDPRRDGGNNQGDRPK